MTENMNISKRDPDMPHLGRLGNLQCPRAPQTIADARLEDGTLTNLALKAAFTINRFSEEWLCERLFIAPALADAIAVQLASEGLIEETMMSSRERHTYRLTSHHTSDPPSQQGISYAWQHTPIPPAMSTAGQYPHSGPCHRDKVAASNQSRTRPQCWR